VQSVNNGEIENQADWSKKTLLQCTSDFSFDFNDTTKQIIDTLAGGETYYNTIDNVIYDIGKELKSLLEAEVGFGINSSINDSLMPEQAISLFTTGVTKSKDST
jgi:hypothetical protein